MNKQESAELFLLQTAIISEKGEIMSLSSLLMNHGPGRKARGVTISAPTEIDPDLVWDYFDLNKSHPCAQASQFRKNCLDFPYQCNIGSLAASLPHPAKASQMNESMFSQLIDGRCVLSQTPAALNPNKIIISVDPKTQEIISLNERALYLFKCSAEELIGKKLSQVLAKSSQVIVNALEEDFLLEGGTVAAVSGKVVNVVTPSGEVPVSVCTYKQQGNWILVAENIEMMSAFVSFSKESGILSCDASFAHLFGYHHPRELTGMAIKQLIPSLKIYLYSHALPKSFRMQQVDGRSRQNASIPLCVKLQGAILCGTTQQKTDMSSSAECCDELASLQTEAETKAKRDSLNVSTVPSLEYSGSIWAFTPITGLLLLHIDGSIYSIHNYLALSLFGYNKEELIGKTVNLLMPGFYGWISGNEDGESKLPNSQEEEPCACPSKISNADPPSLVAGDMVMVNQSLKDRTTSGRGRIFTGADTRLDHHASAMSHLSPPAVTSTRVPLHDDTAELLEEAARIAPCSGEISNADTTEELLQTFALVEPPGEDTYCLVSTKVKRKEKPNFCSQAQRQTSAETIKDVLHNSSFEVISIESMGSSGFCEKFPGHAGSNPDRPEHSSSGHVAGSSSCFLDLNSDGELVTRALADLNLSGSIELLNSRERNHETQRSTTTCDCVGLRTESPGVSGSDQGRLSPNTVTPSAVENVPNDSEQHQLANIQPLSNIHATSTPKKEKHSIDLLEMLERQFEGYAYHRDGTRIDVQCDVGRCSLPNVGFLYSVWISRPGQQGSALQNESGSSLAEKIAEATQGEALRTTMDLEHSRACNGQFEEQYQTLKAVGKGAFGFVWKAIRHSDGQEVVVKFINKARIVGDRWVDDPMLGRVSQEIAILTRVQHHNIVKVLEIFENDNYFQMVMEKHGDCLDLFEFIDRQPMLDEPLASYIFRQLVAAVFYLRTKDILHRDIKDENIIIDKGFHIQLIDFGSAAMMMPGKLFFKFYGTLEYCSPEVLRGNPYEGPELEMWSLGVLLFTLLFSENPFCGVEEILSAKLKLPCPLSPELQEVLCGLLHPHPRERMTLDQLLLQSWISQAISLSEYSWAEVMSVNHSCCSPPPESSPRLYLEQGLFPDGDETLPDDDDDDDDERFALENELQKHLSEG